MGGRDIGAGLRALQRDLGRGGCRIDSDFVYLSHFPPGWRNPPRRLDRHLLFLITNGHGWIRLLDPVGERRRFRAGDALWIPAGTAHETGCVDGAPPPAMHHARFRLRDARGHAIGPAPGMLVLPHAWSMQPVMELWTSTWLRQGPQRDRRQMACLDLAVAELLELMATTRAPERRLSPEQRRICADLVERRIGEDISSLDLARACGLGRIHFARLFRASFGAEPRTWIKEQRLRRAASLLLASDDAVGAIARALGYRNQPLFARQFRALFSCSPRTYRQRHYSPLSARGRRAASSPSRGGTGG